MICKLTTHNMPEYNRISKWVNWTVMDKVLVMLHKSKLSNNLWGEAATYAMYVKNRMAICMLYSKTPNEILLG